MLSHDMVCHSLIGSVMCGCDMVGGSVLLRYLHEIRDQQAVDNEARGVFGAHCGLADVLTKSAHLTHNSKNEHHR